MAANVAEVQVVLSKPLISVTQGIMLSVQLITVCAVVK